MAQPKTLKFGNFKVYIGNDADPPVYAAPCGFTQRSLTLTAQTNDQAVPPCEDEDAAVWTGREKGARSAAVNGAGLLATEDFAKWREAFLSDDSVPVRVVLQGATLDGAGYWQGNAHVTDVTLTGNLGQKTELSVAMSSDGPWAWIAGAPPAPEEEE